MNSLPVAAINGNTILCAGQSTALTASSGRYLWNNGATTATITVTPASMTTYSVTVTDANGCTDSQSVTVTVDPPPVAAISGNTILCAGQSTTLTASGGASYLWNNGATTAAITVTPAATTIYSVTVTDVNGCTDIESVTVTVNPLPVAGVSGNTMLCAGQSTTLTTGGSASYLWNNKTTAAAAAASGQRRPASIFSAASAEHGRLLRGKAGRVPRRRRNGDGGARPTSTARPGRSARRVPRRTLRLTEPRAGAALVARMDSARR